MEREIRVYATGTHRALPDCIRATVRLAGLKDTYEAAAEELKVRLADMNIRVLAGAEALCEAATLPEADTVVVAVCGFAALRPTLTAIHEKKRIALANKETMVCAGEILDEAILKLVKRQEETV